MKVKIKALFVSVYILFFFTSLEAQIKPEIVSSFTLSSVNGMSSDNFSSVPGFGLGVQFLVPLKEPLMFSFGGLIVRRGFDYSVDYYRNKEFCEYDFSYRGLHLETPLYLSYKLIKLEFKLGLQFSFRLHPEYKESFVHDSFIDRYVDNEYELKKDVQAFDLGAAMGINYQISKYFGVSLGLVQYFFFVSPSCNWRRQYSLNTGISIRPFGHASEKEKVNDLPKTLYPQKQQHEGLIVNNSLYVKRVEHRRTGEGDKLIVTFKSISGPLWEMGTISVRLSSGQYFLSSQSIQINKLQFPANFYICFDYYLGAFKTPYQGLLECEILEPGSWELIVYI